MVEHRRYPRDSICLDVAVRLSGWEQHITADISRGGLSIRTGHSRPVSRLIQCRIQLPGDDQPLELLTRVAYSASLAEALERGLLPRMGLQIFRLAPDDARRWHRFISALHRRSTQLKGCNRYTLYRSLLAHPCRLLPGEKVLEPFLPADLFSRPGRPHPRSEAS